MSGHSKWSKVKHQKATTDAVKSAAFTRASRALTVAVREGGGVTDPMKNFRLRLAIDQARAVNMPKDTIERAIERGNAANAQGFESVIYEGYGPGGVAYLIEAATDNKQRTSANVKHQLDRAGGSIASPGAVGFQFLRCGIILVGKGGATLDAIMEAALEAGADDVIEREDVFEVYTKDVALSEVKENLGRTGLGIEHADLIMKALQFTHPDPVLRSKNEELMEKLESLDDVQKVYSTME